MERHKVLQEIDIADAIDKGLFDSNQNYYALSFFEVTNKKNISIKPPKETLDLYNSQNIHFNDSVKTETVHIVNTDTSSIVFENNQYLSFILNGNIDKISVNLTVKNVNILSLNIDYNRGFTLNIKGNCDKLDLQNIDFEKIAKSLTLDFKEIELSNCNVPEDLTFLNVSSMSIITSNLKNLILNENTTSLILINCKQANVNNIINENLHLKDVIVSNTNTNVLINENPNLETLDLKNCNIISIFGLEKCKNLRSLSLYGNKITNIDFIPDSLKELNISNNKITSLSKLPSNLESLYIGQNNIKKLPPLPLSLQNLHINNTLITNIETVFKLQKLRELNISNLGIESIESFPNTLERLVCSDNNLKKLPSLPPNLKTLNCSNNLLTNLPKLPSTLTFLLASKNLIKDISKLLTQKSMIEHLNLSNNKIKGRVILPSKVTNVNLSNNFIDEISIYSFNIIFLNIEHNNLIKFPILRNECFISQLKAAYNNIDDETDFLSYVSHFCSPDLIGNPVYSKVFKEVTESDFNIRTVKYGRDKVQIATIPQGTVLFRGYVNPDPSSSINDLIGFKPQGSDKHTVIPYTNVFFYPYPFLSERIGIGELHREMIFVTTRPIEVVLGILPSLNYRSERYTAEYTISCDKVKWKNFKGFGFDPCLTEGFITQNKSVVGNLVIAEMDADSQKCMYGEDVLYNKYHKLFKDVLQDGVPEFILYPLKERVMDDVVTDYKNVTKQYLFDHMNDFNYFPIYVVKGRDNMKNIVDQLLTPEGAPDTDKVFGVDTLHMTIDPQTNFFVMYEAADEETRQRLIPIEENDKLKYL